MLTGTNIACEQSVYLYAMVSIFVHTENSDVDHLTPKVVVVLRGGDFES